MKKQVYLCSQAFDFVVTNPYGSNKEKNKIAKLLRKARLIQTKIRFRLWKVNKCSICGKKLKASQATVISDHKNIFHAECRKEEA